ncbi:MAG: ferrochelatase [Gammaproteobacteria bacterium]|nr:ferrochelatase [Gammaproteobacteria bacterium]
MTRYPATTPATDTAPITGVLLVNLGTPDAPTPAAVRRYLAEFLWDPRVVESPRWFWWLVLHGFILRYRPPRVAKVYQSIWGRQGSPLLTHSLSLAKAVAASVPANVVVRCAMNYGNPSIASVLAELNQHNLQRLLVLPLYPQYSATTSAAVFDAVTRELRRWRKLPDLRFCLHYYNHPQYIDVLAGQIRHSFQTQGRPQKLLFSFHGIPQRYCKAGDPYEQQCYATAAQVAARLELGQEQWQLTFQSRFGREPWLEPFTDRTLKAFPGQGITRVQIIAPGFAVDCLETLEELAIQNREFFTHAGGQTFHYIPALNDSAAHVALIRQLIDEQTAGWHG